MVILLNLIKVDIDNADNIGFLIEHPKLYDSKSGLYNLKLFAQVLGKGFDKAYTEQNYRCIWY